MAVAAAVYGGYPPSQFRPSSPSPPRIAAQIKPSPTPPPSVFISTNPAHVNPHHLRELYAICNHSCHRFPTIDAAGRVEPVDALKLRKALSHSPVVVSAFTKPEFLTTQSSASPEMTTFTGIGGDWIRKVAPVTPENGRLIGFGRAVSDLGLTASIYDVMVHPALQERSLTEGIYDCFVTQRHFFRACGFGDDMLGSITMMYTRSSSGYSNNEQTISAGRKQLRTSSLWKLQWFAVGWIQPEDKYCSRVDTSGNANPVWKTKFSVAVDTSESKFQDLALHVEVYSREPIFLRESLLGSATIVLKEFLDKYDSKSEVSKPVEEVGSFQLRKKNSNKPRGFIDISIRISEEREGPSSSFPGGEERFNSTGHYGGINLASEHGTLQSSRPPLPPPTSQQPEGINMMPIPPNYSHHPPVGGANYAATGGPSYQPPRTSPPPPPPPPPPANVGYFPNFFPTNNYTPSSYINMPSSVAPPGHGRGHGFGMGAGAGALAAGAVIFGDDFLTGFDLPGASGDPSITISTYPPF
ncbi:UNVERIFIED_CONTAM: hypothetical protein Scaly_2470700 [Sesamum calycinum]|uniref:C2 domain-containing protein n=1 Tax=Sesamum calycinum TaxID=2727403 RepID=A0AAW2LU30_9LAMI